MPPGFQPSGGGGSVNIDGMEAATFGWNRVMKDPVIIVAGSFIGLLCMSLTGTLLGFTSSIFQIAAIDMQRSDPEIYLGVIYGIKFVAQVINFLVASLFAGGYVRFMLNIARGNAYSISDIFSETKLFGRMLVARFLVGLVVGVGMMLCFVPGIVLALGLSQTNYLVVDKGMEPIEAMKESWRLTEGQRVNLLLYGFIGFGIALVGLLACCVGLFVATPVLAIGSAYLHLRLTRQPTAALVLPARLHARRRLSS
jgi:uncharacterized membrane protein